MITIEELEKAGYVKVDNFNNKPRLRKDFDIILGENGKVSLLHDGAFTDIKSIEELEQLSVYLKETDDYCTRKGKYKDTKISYTKFYKDLYKRCFLVMVHPKVAL